MRRKIRRKKRKGAKRKNENGKSGGEGGMNGRSVGEGGMNGKWRRKNVDEYTKRETAIGR
jgi:hypothetical protein